MGDLFQNGDFTLSSGRKSGIKVECDSLSERDWEGLAYLASKLVGPFSNVVGVPRGGIKLAETLKRFANPCPVSYAHLPHDYCDGTKGPRPLLIVDDVLTTGDSMANLQEKLADADGFAPNGALILGVVAFARGPCPPWVKAINQWPQELWEV